MISDKDGLLLEMYLDGALEGEALLSFEERLKKESTLVEALEERRALHQFLQDQPQREKLKKILPEVAEAHFKSEAKVRSIWQRNAFRIASIAAAIALFIFVWQSWRPASLYDQYANHKTLALAERGSPALDPTSIENAFAAKDYQKAIPLLETYLQSYPKSIEASLYLGICNLEMDHFEKANVLFNGIADGESSFKYSGLWYLALSAIKQKKISSAKNYLTLIPEESDYFGQAKALMKELK